RIEIGPPDRFEGTRHLNLGAGAVGHGAVAGYAASGASVTDSGPNRATGITHLSLYLFVGPGIRALAPRAAGPWLSAPRLATLLSHGRARGGDAAGAQRGAGRTGRPGDALPGLRGPVPFPGRVPDHDRGCLDVSARAGQCNGVDSLGCHATLTW